MRTQQDFTMLAGEDRDINFTIWEDDTDTTRKNINNYDFTWIMQPNERSAVPTIIKTSGSLTITITDAGSGKLTVPLGSADTLSIEGTYYHELEGVDTLGRAVKPAIGHITILPTGTD